MACAALLHDAVEDHAGDIALGGRAAALAVLAGRFGVRTASLIAAVTNPEWEPVGMSTSSTASMSWPACKPAEARHARRKYGRLVSALRELISRPDTPLAADVKDMIADQLDAARQRFAAIGNDQHSDSGVSQPPGVRPGSS